MIHPTAILEGNNSLDKDIEIGPFCTINNIQLGKDSKLFKYVNAYGCEIGSGVKVGAFSEIQSEVKIGNNTTICSHSFICSLVTIEDNVFIGHGVKTINDIHPPSKKRTGKTDEWRPTIIMEGATIGSNATLFPVTIGRHAIVGAGAVVTKDIPDHAVVIGNPARIIKYNNQIENSK
ncbi:N-acetyltransferase [Candidatus Pacearchaeota archaeon]|nr:N-acetyltransferase [Candidatus Pacearchaeota archaeon]